MAHKSPSSLIVGLAFFSMFFGSGNLIFPLMLGAQYESHFLICAIGFVITAVLLPTLGILAMMPAHGRYERLFSDFLPNNLSRWFILAVLMFWIPLGSGPRCVVLAHASINTYFAFTPPIWLFSLLFLVAVYFCVISRNRIIDILGKFLTPMLLLSILAIVVTSFLHGQINVSDMDPVNVFLESIVDGYYTQDLIAAVFFSSALVGMLKACGSNQAECIKKTWQGGLIAVVLLTILYTALMAASAIHSEYLHNLSGEKLVSTLAHIALGSTFGGISSIAVSLACFTTEIALVLVFADFLNQHFFRKHNTKNAILLTLVIIWSMSQLQFGGIMAIVAPAMKVIYPILFLLVIRFLWRSRNQLAE
jgi:branched-chain amino acid:cation transporter, LIVCS family